MITITKSRSLRSITDVLKERKIKKDEIISFFQNSEGDYVIMYEYNTSNDGKQS